jgi:XapX domain-containing protein
MKVVIALSLGFLLGAVCRWFDIPVPSPPKLVGALLVLAVTVGYMAMDNWMSGKSVQAAAQVQVEEPVGHR